MRTKTLLIISAIILFILCCFVIGRDINRIPDGDDENLVGGTYSACCVNADGYCLDMFETEDDRCGNNDYLSEELCGKIEQCEPHCCYIDGVKQKTLMNNYECDKLGVDVNTTNVNWDPNCNTI